jgi:GNAT superfamily N-acetyltransferase
MTLAVQPPVLADIDSWLEITREVEPLFGPMPKFDITLMNNIARGSALVVRGETGAILGGALLGGQSPDNWLRWLAVRSSVRGRGIGAAILSEILRRCPAPCTISLATFGPDNGLGRPARRLYERFGFRGGEMLPRGPEGGSRQLFTLERP